MPFYSKLMLRFGLAATTYIIAAGCSNTPSRVNAPSYNAGKIANRAIELYDSNSDGMIDEEERKQSPALNASAATIDSSGDGVFSKEEIESCVDGWIDSGTGVIRLRCKVMSRKKPASGLLVKFNPDPCLDGVVPAAEGVTNVFGDAAIAIPEDARPNADFPAGVQFGFYAVSITKEDGSTGGISKKFNENTVLGQEVSYEDPAVANNQVVFNLE